MTPELARYVRIARSRVYGTPLNQEEEVRVAGLDEFKRLLTRKLELGVRIELFVGTLWQWSPDGCSLQFSVDERQFVLRQKGVVFEVLRRLQDQDTLLAVLPDNSEFQDRLLIAIDDALEMRDRRT
jgi:hypothetical protein